MDAWCARIDSNSRPSESKSEVKFRYAKDREEYSYNIRSAHDPSPETSGVLGYSNEAILPRRQRPKLRGTSR
jgi:hypothetical protein